jgi:hypothetical protein
MLTVTPWPPHRSGKLAGGANGQPQAGLQAPTSEWMAVAAGDVETERYVALSRGILEERGLRLPEECAEGRKRV